MLDCFRGSVLGSLIAGYESGGKCFLRDVRGWLPWGLLHKCRCYWFGLLRVGQSWGKSCWDGSVEWRCGSDRVDVTGTEVVDGGDFWAQLGSLTLVIACGGVACMVSVAVALLGGRYLARNFFQGVQIFSEEARAHDCTRAHDCARAHRRINFNSTYTKTERLIIVAYILMIDV